MDLLLLLLSLSFVYISIQGNHFLLGSLITSELSVSTTLNVHINRDIRLPTFHTQPCSHPTASIVIRNLRWPQEDTQNNFDGGYTRSRMFYSVNNIAGICSLRCLAWSPSTSSENMEALAQSGQPPGRRLSTLGVHGPFF